MNNKYLKTAIAGLYLGVAGLVFAQEAEVPLYSVEYIILRHLQPVAGTEIWPLEESDENEVPAQRFAPLQTDQLSLIDIARRLNEARDIRVIHHGGWIQPGFSSEDSRRKIIKRSAATGERVNGYFLMQRERYLRLEMDLTFAIDGELYQMQTGRRMLSRRTHYFDHPYAGIIARITPVEKAAATP